LAVTEAEAFPQALARRLGHEFVDSTRARQALRHRSAGGRHNERLEFLGDAVLGFLVAEALFQRWPRASEGDLTRARARLVRRETLAELALELELGPHLHMGSGELKSGGFRRASILADALEALLAAIYLDGGLEAARAAVTRWYGGRLELKPDAETLKDPKTRLQEWLQGRGFPLPVYELLQAGDGESTPFRVLGRVVPLAEGCVGEGHGRRDAEQVAAAALLERLLSSESGIQA